MKFFSHIDVMIAESTIDPPNQDTQGLPEVNTFLYLFNNWLLDFKCNFTLLLDFKCNFTLLLENLFFLYYQNRTTNILINYCEVFLLGFCCCFVKVQPLFIAWIDLLQHRKPLGIILRAHRWVLAWFPHILFRGVNFPLNNSFQCLNNITRIFTHFFIHMYFQKIQIILLEQYYQTGSKFNVLQRTWVSLQISWGFCSSY